MKKMTIRLTSEQRALIQRRLRWEPSITLRAGLEQTYAWIYEEYAAREKKAVRNNYLASAAAARTSASIR